MIRTHTLHSLPVGVPPPDVYFSQAYGRADVVAGGGDWMLLEAFDGAWQLPIRTRALPDGDQDATSPYGYSGLYASPHLATKEVEVAWAETIRALRDLRVVSLFLRRSPLVAQAPRHSDEISVTSSHPTIVMDLASEEGMWDAMEGRCRTAVRKAVNLGYTSGIRTASRPDIDSCSAFRQLYDSTMHRHNATSFIFANSYYQALCDGLRDSLLIAEVRDLAGGVVSSALFMQHKPFMHYHLSGSAPSNSGHGTNNLLLWTVARHASKLGLAKLHLGGGLLERDALYKFKRSFGGRELSYNATGLILNHAAYAKYTRLRAAELSLESARLQASSFFPAYRVAVINE